jgi:hypothetical protein
LTRLALLPLVLLAGCASHAMELAPGFDPRAPRRVAVLPFCDDSTGDGASAVPLALLLDEAPVLSDESLEAARAAQVMRVKVHQALGRTALEVVPLTVIDTLAAHHRLDVAATYDGDREAAARRLGEALGADAVLFGTVTEWSRDYYGLETHLAAGLELELRDTISGAVLFTGRARDVERIGLSQLSIPIATTPVEAGVYLALDPILGLANTGFGRLSDVVSGQAIEGLAPSAEARAAAPAPTLRVVAHSADRPLEPGDSLVVIALGDPGARATFAVGDLPEVPMAEVAPGTYRGEVVISAAHRLTGAPLRVRLLSAELRSTTMTLARPPVVTARAHPP